MTLLSAVVVLALQVNQLETGNATVEMHCAQSGVQLKCEMRLLKIDQVRSPQAIAFDNAVLSETTSAGLCAKVLAGSGKLDEVPRSPELVAWCKQPTKESAAAIRAERRWDRKDHCLVITSKIKQTFTRESESAGVVQWFAEVKLMGRTTLKTRDAWVIEMTTQTSGDQAQTRRQEWKPLSQWKARPLEPACASVVLIVDDH